jgi:hypothetical protein
MNNIGNEMHSMQEVCNVTTCHGRRSLCLYCTLFNGSQVSALRSEITGHPN